MLPVADNTLALCFTCTRMSKQVFNTPYTDKCGGLMADGKKTENVLVQCRHCSMGVHRWQNTSF